MNSIISTTSSQVPEVTESFNEESPAGEPVKLTEGYETLLDLLLRLIGLVDFLQWNRVDSNLGRICRIMENMNRQWNRVDSNLGRICRIMENMNIGFTLDHLAQLKFFFDGAIAIKSISVFRKTIGFPQPEIHISLDLNALDDDWKPDLNKSLEARLLDLKPVLFARFVKLSQSYPEDKGIPRVELHSPDEASGSLPSFLARTFHRAQELHSSNNSSGSLPLIPARPFHRAQELHSPYNSSGSLPLFPARPFHGPLGFLPGEPRLFSRFHESRVSPDGKSYLFSALGRLISRVRGSLAARLPPPDTHR